MGVGERKKTNKTKQNDKTHIHTHTHTHTHTHQLCVSLHSPEKMLSSSLQVPLLVNDQ